MKMKRGDLLPVLEVTCTDSGQPVDLTDATEVRIVAVQGITQLIDEEVTVADPETGVVTRPWEAGETDTVGRIFVNVIATWGTEPQTFPPDGSLAVDITPSERVSP